MVVMLTAALLAGAATARPAGGFVFVPDTTQLVCIHRGEWGHAGYLDADGLFTESHRYRRTGPLGGGLQLGSLINRFPPGVPVYELFAGWLIPGALDAQGQFVPDKGGKTVPFADYKFGPRARQVWNLPGRFRPAEPGEIVPADRRH